MVKHTTKKRYLLVFFVSGILTMLLTLFSLPLLKEIDELNFQIHVSAELSVANLKSKICNESGRRNLIEQISLINKEEKIKNEEIFGTSNSNYSVVIVIQVHNRIHYLEYLIRSLGQAHGIDKTLLVFSHDVFDENINRLVNSIRFCKYIQIFYPYSFQAYPDVFPGHDPRDCPKYTTKNETIDMGCMNFRNPQLNQAKHHWWWKANRVFDLASLQFHDGLVLYLEEDNYLLEDFIHVLKLMEDIAKYSCRHCKLLALANHWESEKVYTFTVKTSKVGITDRFSSCGMAFNREVWREIAKCKYLFCAYDNYNYDFSLRNVFLNCMKATHFLVLYAARVFHLGVCGLHYTSWNCDPAVKLQELKTFLRKGLRYLYPTQLQLVYHRQHPHYGIYEQWNDSRDYALCLGMTIR